MGRTTDLGFLLCHFLHVNGHPQHLVLGLLQRDVSVLTICRGFQNGPGCVWEMAVVALEEVMHSGCRYRIYVPVTCKIKE